MKPIAVVVLLLTLLAASHAGAQHQVLTLVPSPEELAAAHRDTVKRRSIFIAGVATQGAGLGLTMATLFGAFGNREGMIAGGSVALCLGVTSLVLIPVGAVQWARAAKRERILRGDGLTF